jgi:Domain of unknown function (DUF4062)
MAIRSTGRAETILIDRAAAAELPSADEVREWARSKQVFISSVMSELPAERQAVANAVRTVGLVPVMFEEFGAREADAEEAYLAEVESAEIFIGILGRRYGKPLKSRYSATHAEYRHALDHVSRMALWTSSAADREGPEQSFLDEVRVFHVVPEFSTPADLQRRVEERLNGIAAEDLAPWCKLGNIVFRAVEVDSRGDVIHVKARVRDEAVARAIEAARGDNFNRGIKTRFTWAGRSEFVKVAKVHFKTTAARTKMFDLELEVEEAPREPLLDVAFGKLTPADRTESALRTVLFGEPNPLADQYLSSMAEIPDPFAPLRQNPVSEEIIRPIAELLVTDVLVGSGRAASIRTFRLGVANRGRRRLTLAWEVAGRYSNAPSTVRSITGDLSMQSREIADN